MLIVKVLKPLVSTNRIPDFEHKHLQVVLDGSTKKWPWMRWVPNLVTG